MQIDIIIYVRAYGQPQPFVPPSIGLRLAARTPVCHKVRIIHPPLECVQRATKASLVCLLFDSSFAKQAYRLGIFFAVQRKMVVMGGPHVNRQPDEASQYCQAIITGEIEQSWAPWLASLAPNQKAELTLPFVQRCAVPVQCCTMAKHQGSGRLRRHARNMASGPSRSVAA